MQLLDRFLLIISVNMDISIRCLNDRIAIWGNLIRIMSIAENRKNIFPGLIFILNPE